VRYDGSLETTQLGRAIHLLEFRNPSTEEAFVVIISHFLNYHSYRYPRWEVIMMVAEDIPVDSPDGRDVFGECFHLLQEQASIIMGGKGSPNILTLQEQAGSILGKEGSPNILTKVLKGGKLHVIANFCCDNYDLPNNIGMWIVVKREVTGYTG
jgi:hypothetical protein